MRVFEVTTDWTWVQPIVAAAQALETDVLCNQGAVGAGRMDLATPSAEQLFGYMRAGGDEVIVAHDGSRLEGYLVVRDLDGECQGKWVGVFNHADAAPIYRGMLALAVSLYGPIHGRVTNDELREWLREAIPGTIDHDDPQIIRYGG